jgi:enoyl-CoA hydratase
MQEYPGFRVVKDEGMATVTIDRPESRNALTSEMRRNFGLIFSELDEASDVKAVVLTGADPSFSGGVDVKERFAGDKPLPLVKPNPGEVLRGCRTPVIAAVNGPCVTGGLEMALSCTFMIASDRAVFRDSHAVLGLMPGWGLSALLPRAVGIRVAREMTLTGRPLNAMEAYSAGLVNRVVPHEDLLDSAQAAASQITEIAPLVIETALDLYQRGHNLPLDEALVLERSVADAWKTNSAQAKAGVNRATNSE